MKKILLLCFLFMSLTPAFSQKIRRILLFANDSTNLDLRSQQAWLRADTTGIEQRDLFIAVFTAPRTHRAIFERFDANDSDFLLVLIGSDSEEKFRSEQPLPLTELYRVIDTGVTPQQAQRKN